MVKDMTSGSPMRLIFSFALPLLMGNLLQQTYSLVDAALVGQFLGMNALAGVGASSSVLFLILGFCNGLTGGFGIPVAQSVGAKRDDHVRDYVRHSYLLGGVISVFLAVVCSMLCSHILRWMQTPEEIFQEANIYLLVTFITIPINLYYNLISSIIRALGDSKTPFYFMLLSTILNIIFDLIFILLLRWGVAGAAIATALAQLICIDGCLRYMKRHFSILYNPDESFSLNLKRVHKLLMMGIPWDCSSALQQLVVLCCRVPTIPWGPFVLQHLRLACASRCFAFVPSRTLVLRWLPIVDKIWEQLADSLRMPQIILYVSVVEFFALSKGWFFACFLDRFPHYLFMRLRQRFWIAVNNSFV